LGLLLFSSRSRAADQTLKFNFETGHPFVYSIEAQIKTITDRSGQVQGRSQSSLTKLSTTKKYKLRFVPQKKNKDGTWTVRIEPFDYYLDKDLTGQSGHITTSLHDLSVRGTQNGIIIMDTDKGVGVAQSRLAKQEAFSELLSGTLDFTPTGKVVRMGGDLPFVDFWTNHLELQLGFFNILLPEKSVAPGGSWQENLNLSDLEGLKLTDGLIETNVFTLSPTQVAPGDTTVSIDRLVAADWKDITGSVDSMGQSTMLNISELKHDESGKIGFDTAHGRIVKLSDEENVHMVMSMLVQGNSITSTIDLNSTIKIELLPDAQ
jgi:hypothetical protein